MGAPDGLPLPAGLPFGRRGVAVLIAGVLVLSAAVDPAWLPHLPGLCVVRRVTGVPCPGCGLTRSFVATAHGDLGAAFSLHPFGPPLFAACVLALTLLVAGALRGRPILSRPAWARLKPVGWGVLALWLGFAAARAAAHVL